MLKSKMISIIIPTYNRYDLLGQTLDSIYKQTFTNWECIIVDDRSNDYTKELVEFYSSKDSRFYYYERPKTLIKGANSCRNYGFSISRGCFIQFFDSDDLMDKEFLALKFQTFQEKNCDFVISKSKNFRDPNPHDVLSNNENYYRFDNYPITNKNYIEQKINWLTYDFIGKREILQKIEFNRNLSSGQEYNYFCKLTSFNTNGEILDRFLTYRRIHNCSIQSGLRKNRKILNLDQLKLQFYTWRDLKSLGNAEGAKICFYKCIGITLTRKCEWSKILGISNEFFINGKISLGLSYLLYQIFSHLFSKGDFFRRKFISFYNLDYRLYGQF